MVCSGVLHWLISQSVFLATIESYDVDRELMPRSRIATCGFSPPITIVVMVVGVLVLMGTIVLSRKKFLLNMPIIGSCSVAISAACQAPGYERDTPCLKSVQWGVVPSMVDETGSGHCTFSSLAVEEVKRDQTYAGLVQRVPCTRS